MPVGSPPSHRSGNANTSRSAQNLTAAHLLTQLQNVFRPSGHYLVSRSIPMRDCLHIDTGAATTLIEPTVLNVDSVQSLVYTLDATDQNLTPQITIPDDYAEGDDACFVCVKAEVLTADSLTLGGYAIEQATDDPTDRSQVTSVSGITATTQLTAANNGATGTIQWRSFDFSGLGLRAKDRLYPRLVRSDSTGNMLVYAATLVYGSQLVRNTSSAWHDTLGR